MVVGIVLGVVMGMDTTTTSILQLSNTQAKHNKHRRLPNVRWQGFGMMQDPDTIYQINSSIGLGKQDNICQLDKDGAVILPWQTD